MSRSVGWWAKGLMGAWVLLGTLVPVVFTVFLCYGLAVVISIAVKQS